MPQRLRVSSQSCPIDRISQTEGLYEPITKVYEEGASRLSAYAPLFQRAERRFPTARRFIQSSMHQMEDMLVA